MFTPKTLSGQIIRRIRRLTRSFPDMIFLPLTPGVFL